MTLRIAILGAGLCGLAAAWHLSQDQGMEITLFDPEGIGKSASGIAAGLLHPYAGAHAKKNWRSDEGMAATGKLLKAAEEALGSPVCTANGLLRLAITSEQVTDFLSASNHPDVHWLTASACEKAVAGIVPYPGILIEGALVVDMEKYLEGLWLSCQKKGVRLEQTAIRTLEELSGFDVIVAAMGSATKLLPELSHLPISPIKGQIVELEWPEGLPPLSHPISSQVYLLKHPRRETCLAGATYEHVFKDGKPDPEFALNEILPKLKAFFPAIGRRHFVECRAGVRASAPHHRPLLMRLGKCWVLSGMGSKGLLYHALFAEELMKQICSFARGHGTPPQN